MLPFMDTAVDPAVNRMSLAEHPAIFVAEAHPAHLGACLPRLSEDTIRRLQQCPRLAKPLGAMLAARGGPVAAAGAAPLTGPARLALAGQADIFRAATIMGAIWHAASIRLCIASEAVATLRAGIGADAHRAALCCAKLGVADPQTWSPQELVAAVAHSGEACLSSWLKTQPASAKARILLKLPPIEAAAEDEAHEQTDAIVAAAVDVVMGQETADDAAS